MLEKEWLNKYKISKDELKAAWKVIVYYMLAWFGVVFMVISLIIIIEELKYGSASLGWEESLVSGVVAFAVTSWLEKDIYILTEPALELLANEMSDEIYEKALEKYRQQFGNQKVNEDAN